MIKIEIENIEAVKREYFEGVKRLILQRIDFYLIAFKVIDRQTGVDAIESHPGLETRTKTAWLNILGKSKDSITRKEDYNRLLRANSLKTHFYTHRNDYITLLTSLSDEVNLKTLILAEADDLLAEAQKYTQPWFTRETRLFITKIFPYDTFIDKNTGFFSAYDLSRLLKINVCVYCNRIYTNTVIATDGKLIIRPTLDHYFLQSAYPLLGLSFYNLIPSCYYCNMNLKGEKLFNLHTHMHPYKEGFGKDACFDYLQAAFHADKSDPRNYLILIRGNIDSADARYVRMFGNGVPDSGNVDVFRLKEIYQAHADVVGELIVKADKYSPYYAGNIVNMLAGLGASKKEFYRYYFGNYIEERDFNKRPLAKLTKDLVSKYIPEMID